MDQGHVTMHLFQKSQFLIGHFEGSNYDMCIPERSKDRNLKLSQIHTCVYRPGVVEIETKWLEKTSNRT